MTRLLYDQYKTRFPALDDPSDQNREERLALFNVALATRNFEIDNYWKRANYFWIVLASIFGGYFASYLSSKYAELELIRIVLAFLGTLFSWAWYFVNRGSKFWQENWEAHVDLIEPSVHGLLFQTVVREKNPWFKFLSAADFSVSKINTLVSLLVSVIWSFVLAATALDWVADSNSQDTDVTNTFIQCIAIVLGAAIVPSLFLIFTRSNLKPGIAADQAVKPEPHPGPTNSREMRLFELSDDAYDAARSETQSQEPKPSHTSPDGPEGV